MRRFLLLLLAFLLLLAAPIGVRYLRYYGLDQAAAEAPPEFDPGEVPAVPTPTAGNFVDDPEVGQGWVLLDEAHENDFDRDELGYLDGRLAARGYELLPYAGGDLAGALRPVDAFIVATPLAPFSQEEIQAVSDFVDRGGHLLMVGDPTRFNVLVEETDISVEVNIENDDLPLNTLANEFGIIYRGDYLYNTRESEGNYRNIILRGEDFSTDALADELETVVFYGSHSLEVGAQGTPLLQAGEDTWSSITRRSGALTVAALAREGRVLALGDINFLGEPYNDVYDNARFISRIADFLAEPGRGFVLGDFPYFFSDPVSLIYAGSPELGPDVFDEVIDLQEAFRNVERKLSLTAEPVEGQDALYLGLYNQAEEIAPLLEAAGVTLVIDPPVVAVEEAAEEMEGEDEEADSDEPAAVRQIQSGLGNVQMAGTALILLGEEAGQRYVVVLAASAEGLENTIDRLLEVVPRDADYALSDCLLQETLALCPTNVPGEAVEAELQPGDTLPDEEPEEESEEGEDSGEEGERGDAGGGAGGEYVEVIDAFLQGSIALGESREGTLAPEEAHAWAFDEGPVTIDILLETGEEMDSTLSVFDSDYELVEGVDDGFQGEEERLEGIEVPEGEAYTIVVRDFFSAGGTYTLSVAEAGEAEGEEAEEAPVSIFIFGDDRGTPAGEPFTSVPALASMLEEYEVTTWIASEDGPLEEDTLDGYDLVIWSSGNYRNENVAIDEDSLVIFDHFLNGGALFITGATTTFLEGEEATFAPISDLEVAGDHEVLLDGFESGEIIELDQTYEATLIEPEDVNEEEGSVILFLRGPGSENSGSVAGVTFADEFSGSRLYLLAAPFTALPDTIQESVLDNLLAWLEL